MEDLEDGIDAHVPDVEEGSADGIRQQHHHHHREYRRPVIKVDFKWVTS